MYPIERYNSWLSRRALNRRYPEATLTETYRLFELAYHFRMTNQIPTLSVLDTEDVLQVVQAEDDATVHETSDKNYQKKSTKLSSSNHQHLINYYGQQEQQVVNCVNLLSTYTKIVQYNRSVRCSTDTRAANTNSSWFFLTSSKSSSRIVGNIQIIFEHLFNGMSNILLP